MKTTACIFRSLILLFSVFLVCCKKNNNPVLISNDFTYTGLLLSELPVTFHNASKNASLSWDFGDGTHSAERSPVHSYATAGTYTVSLSINNNTAGTVRKTIIIGKNPKYTQQMGGLRLWRHTSYVTSPSGGSVTYHPDTSFAIEYVDLLTVSINKSFFHYSGSSNGDTTLTYERRVYDGEFLLHTDYLYYTPRIDSLYCIINTFSTMTYRASEIFTTP